MTSNLVPHTAQEIANDLRAMAKSSDMPEPFTMDALLLRAANALEALSSPSETPAPISVKDEREIGELRAALKVAQQALLEFSHAQESGPRWYTRREDGMYKQVHLWLRRGLKAVRTALGPYDDNGRYLKEMPTEEPTAQRFIGMDLAKPGSDKTVYQCKHGTSDAPCPHCWAPHSPENATPVHDAGCASYHTPAFTPVQTPCNCSLSAPSAAGALSTEASITDEASGSATVGADPLAQLEDDETFGQIAEELQAKKAPPRE